MRYQARAPLRIDFGGGWTDVPLYASTEGGAVLNAAITRYARGSISRPTGSGILRALRSDRSYLEYSVDAPAGAGLGASAAQTVLWYALVKSTIANTTDRRQIAELAWETGGMLGILGGKQDEYASALGGINYLTVTDTVDVERLALDASFTERLRSRLLLVYTGESRISATVHATVWDRYLSGNPATISALAELKRLATHMKAALLSHDLDSFASLIADNWRHQKALAPEVESNQIAALIELGARHGALAGKACGAGGGGCVLLVAAEGREAQLRNAVSKQRLAIIDFDFDSYGVHLSKG